MKSLIIKTLFLLLTLVLTVIMIGSVVIVFISPLLAVACFVGSLAAVVGICELNGAYETRGE